VGRRKPAWCQEKAGGSGMKGRWKKFFLNSIVQALVVVVVVVFIVVVLLSPFAPFGFLLTLVS